MQLLFIFTYEEREHVWFKQLKTETSIYHEMYRTWKNADTLVDCGSLQLKCQRTLVFCK